jgi:hypothetical protein
MNKNNENIRRLQKSNYANIPVGIGEKQASFKISIKRFITDVDGTIKAKSFLPTFAQVNYPVWMFGNYDLDGGYAIGQKLLPLNEGLFYLNTGTAGVGFDLLSFTGANNVKDQINIGDQIFLFSDSEQFPSFFVWIVISGGQRSYSSILSNPLNEGMNTFMMKYFVDNERQFNETLQIVNVNEIGNYKTYPVPPLRYKTTTYEQENFIDLIMPYKISNYSGMYFYMDFSCDVIDFVIRYHKPQIGLDISFDNRVLNNLRTVKK